MKPDVYKRQIIDSNIFRESNKVVASPIPQPHCGSQLCIDNLGISGRGGRRVCGFGVKDLSEDMKILGDVRI